MNDSALDRVLANLRDQGKKIIGPGAGGNYSAHCPAHDDKHPSLSILDVNERVLLKCHRNPPCDIGDIAAALGLRIADLFDNGDHVTYHYDNHRDVVRKIDKGFLQTSTGNPPELYHLADVRAAVGNGEVIYITEGEQDADALRKHFGVTATTAPMGAGKWGKIDSAPLAGCHAVIVADKDDPGMAHAEDIRRTLESLDPPATTDIVVAKVGKDSADHMLAGYGLSEFVPYEPPQTNRIVQLHKQLRLWVDGDLDHYTFACAVAVAAADPDGEPLWGMIVGAPSGGKTESTRMLGDIAHASVDELTAPALLGWQKVGKDYRQTGVLSEIGNDPDAALVVIGDFSTLLAGSNRHSGSDKEQLFADLRRVYDGSLTRHLGNAPKPLNWHGKVTILTAVTQAIDAFAMHNDALGPRWLYFRVPAVATKRSSRARQGIPLMRRRAEAAKLARGAVRAGRDRLPEVELSGDSLDALDEAADLAAHARGSVPRDGYGRREIIGEPVVEEPYRLRQQLQILCRSLIALGLAPVDAERMTVKSALDTIPETRCKVLVALADGYIGSVRGLANRSGVNDRKVTRRAAEDLRALGLAYEPVEDQHEGETDESIMRQWQIDDGTLGRMAQTVIAGQRLRGGVPK